MAGSLAKLGIAGRPKILMPRFQTMWSLPANLLLSRFVYRASQPYYRSKFYNKILGDEPSGKPVLALADDLPGNPARGLDIIKGVLAFGGQIIVNPVPLCHPPEASNAWIGELARFDWLKDLRALGGPTARRVAQLMVVKWLEESGNYDPLTWQIELVTARLRNLLLYFSYLQEEAGEGRSLILRAVNRHLSHLKRALPGNVQGAALIKAALVLILAGILLPKADQALRKGQKILDKNIKRQFFADGGHKERNPSSLLAMLEYMADVKEAFMGSGQALPEKIEQITTLWTFILRFFRHNDGGLALFNGSFEEEKDRIDYVIKRAALRNTEKKVGKKSPFLQEINQLPNSGFQRAGAGLSTIIADCGTSSPRGFDDKAHAGALSFEFSHDGERIVVNCGNYPFQAAWQYAGRRTPAHSTMTLDDLDSALLLKEGGMVLPPQDVFSRREEDGGRIWIDMQHNGYESTHGLLHKRRIFLSSDGLDIRGEDQLIGISAADIPFALRFHFHPSVEISLALDGQSALIKTPKKHVFRFRLAEGKWQQEESIYCGIRGKKEKSYQLVFHGVTQSEMILTRWALSREDRR